jgi:hypothetical protein
MADENYSSKDGGFLWVVCFLQFIKAVYYEFIQVCIKVALKLQHSNQPSWLESDEISIIYGLVHV